jgi:flagellar hook assembly protein FlgD
MTPEESTLRIYNTLGQLVRTFEASNLQARGVSLVRWDGTNNSGETASSGVYFVVLNTPRGTHAAKLLMMK